MMRETKQEMLTRVGTMRGFPGATLGDRVEVDGKRGDLIGGNQSANFDILFDDDGVVANCHPGWKFRFLTARECSDETTG